MKRTPSLILAVAFLLGLLLPNVTQAVLMRLDFSVLGDLADPYWGIPGEVRSGYLTFDSGQLPNGGGQQNIVLSNLSFWWGATTFDETNTSLDVTFDQAGHLTAWSLSGGPPPVGLLGSPTGFVLYADPQFPFSFRYHWGFTEVVNEGNLAAWSFGPVTNVAEPGTLEFLGLGLTLFAVIRRRRSGK